MNLSETAINENFSIYLTKLQSTGVDTSLLVEQYGEKLKVAPAAPNYDSGLAYKGALINFLLRKVARIAACINMENEKKGLQLLVNSLRVNEKSLLKVCLLHQISKCLIFEENDDEYMVKKRGLIYKYVNYDYALRFSARSVKMCYDLGISLTDEEYEAMLIMDKVTLNDTFTDVFSSPMSVIIKQANEWANIESKQTIKLNK